MIINKFNIYEENFQNSINNIEQCDYLNSDIQLNNKFDRLLDGILLEKNQKGELN